MVLEDSEVKKEQYSVARLLHEKINSFLIHVHQNIVAEIIFS